MMSDALDQRRRKLRFRAWRRGFREMDLLMGSFADDRLDGFSEAQLDQFEHLLAIPDWEVFAWLTAQKTVPDNHASEVLDQLIAFRYEAQPG